MAPTFFRPLLCAALLASAAPLAAQTPFRAGQWGADFFIGNGFDGAGLVHFRSPSHAVVLDLGANLGMDRRTAAAGVQHFTSIWLVPSLEFRSYRPITGRVMRMAGWGFTGIYQRLTNTSTADTTHLFAYGAGVFAALGAQWMVTDHLSIGARGRLSVGWEHQGATGTVGNANYNDDNVSIGFGAVSLLGALYF